MSIFLIATCLVAAFLALGLRLNKNYVPGPYDSNLLIAASATKTANFNTASLDLGAGYAPGGCGAPVAAVVDATAGDRANQDETYTFTLEESSDNTNFTACGPGVAVTVATTVFTTGAISVPGFVSKRYVRVALVVAGTTPSITYSTHLVPIGRPG